VGGHTSVYQQPWRLLPHRCVQVGWFAVGPAAVWTITFHVLELVAVAVVLLLYLLIKVWRRI
jgi:presenilin-like A22 family membrane protease